MYWPKRCFQHPKTQEVWETLQEINSCSAIHHLNRARLSPLCKLDKSEVLVVCDELSSVRNDSTQYERVHIDFLLEYVNSAMKPNEQIIQSFTRLLDELSSLSLSTSNLAALCYNNRGIGYHESEEYEKAIEDYSKAIQISSTYSLAYNNRGLSYYVQEEQSSPEILQCAERDFRKAIEYDVNYMDPTYHLGLVLRDCDHYVESMKCFAIASEVSPKSKVLPQAKRTTIRELLRGSDCPLFGEH